MVLSMAGLRRAAYEVANYRKVFIEGNSAEPLMHVAMVVCPGAWLYESLHHNRVEAHMKGVREKLLGQYEAEASTAQASLDAARDSVVNCAAVVKEVERKRDEAVTNMPRLEQEAKAASDKLAKLKKEIAEGGAH